ncbi:MAG: septal ring lytic transglycosylase RlpA family protein [Bryobacteraceae bacterium]
MAKPPRIGSTESGIASWYGHPYHGRRAANGEIYDMEKLTAAHRTYKFETWVRVKNLTNDKTVDVRIQDRGPFIDGRIIDLSKAAAREIGLLGLGVAKVRLTVIEPPARRETPQSSAQIELFAVQAGAFRELANAELLRDRMRERYGKAQIRRRDGSPPVWRCWWGRSYLGAAEALQNSQRWNPGLAVRFDNPVGP